MKNLILVAFLEPVTRGAEFPRARWPLHMTLVKFDVGHRAGGESGGSDEVVAGVVAHVKGHQVQKLGAVVSTPAYTLQNYRPHVTRQGERRFHRGDVVVLDRIALVDMAPDGDRRIRRVLELWVC
ncbi:hypothetical protein [Arthrobacter sp.]|uniref:hypothetical protein n=1 Tax=Arthrobacter sp. TaxID=1667 RepID=UPI002811F47D|nr:hypothetical protein [Arthrobacter sp.]